MGARLRRVHKPDLRGPDSRGSRERAGDRTHLATASRPRCHCHRLRVASLGQRAGLHSLRRPQRQRRSLRLQRYHRHCCHRRRAAAAQTAAAAALAAALLPAAAAAAAIATALAAAIATALAAAAQSRPAATAAQLAPHRAALDSSRRSAALGHHHLGARRGRRPPRRLLLRPAQAPGTLPDVLDLQPDESLLPPARQGRGRHRPVGGAPWVPWCSSLGATYGRAALGPSRVGPSIALPGSSLALLRPATVVCRLRGPAAQRKRALAQRTAWHAHAKPKPRLARHARHGGRGCGRLVSPPPRRAYRAIWRQ